MKIKLLSISNAEKCADGQLLSLKIHLLNIIYDKRCEIPFFLQENRNFSFEKVLKHYFIHLFHLLEKRLLAVLSSTETSILEKVNEPKLHFNHPSSNLLRTSLFEAFLGSDSTK